MAVQCSVFIASSLDGFIARADGRIDWLEAANARLPAGEDCGYAEFMRSVDALVMGRYTFELAQTFTPWPYAQTPVSVLGSRPLAIAPALQVTVSASSETPQALCERLGRAGARRLYVDGGLTIQRFLAAGLIDDLTVTLIPCLLGSGRRLFGVLPADIQLERLDTRSYPFGFVQLRYAVVRGH